MKIHVGVGAYRLVLNVDMTDERLYREAGIHVGEVYDDLALRYPQKSPEELWMLAAKIAGRAVDVSGLCNDSRMWKSLVGCI